MLAACGSESEPAQPPVVAGGETAPGRVSRIQARRSWRSRAFPTQRHRSVSFVGVHRHRSSPRGGSQPATEFGPACIQHPDHVPDWYRYLAETFGAGPGLVPELEPTSEDCLHLNVWTANLGGKEPWPVLVWIHGGANTLGLPD